MARLSDLIEDLLKQMIDENQGYLEITRGELAERVRCVPSQITYVLSTRFTNGQGYTVESRRGGGGWIRIQRIVKNTESPSPLLHILRNLPSSLSQQESEVLLRNLVEQGQMTQRLAQLLFAACNDTSLQGLDPNTRNKVRKRIFQNFLAQYVLNGGEA